jgi:hypothetical protein
MTRIRYRNELAPGLHAAAERRDRTTTVYLLPGLTVAQRRAALRRLRICARRGYGPRLPAPQLALALLADRILTMTGRVFAVFRAHPAGSTVPVMVLSGGAIAFLALSAASAHVVHPPPRPPSMAAGPGGTAGPDSHSEHKVQRLAETERQTTRATRSRASPPGPTARRTSRIETKRPGPPGRGRGQHGRRGHWIGPGDHARRRGAVHARGGRPPDSRYSLP